MRTPLRGPRGDRRRRLHVRLLGCAVASLASLVACTSATPTEPPDTTDASATLGAAALTIERAATRDLTDLTLEERKELCDWTAKVGGGYGKTTSCGRGVTVANAADQAACLVSYPSACDSVLVREWEACRRKEISDPCATLLFTAPEPPASG